VEAAYRGNGLPSPDESAVAAEPPEPTPEELERIRQMHEAFGVVERIHEALVRGDVTGARAQAEGLEKTVVAHDTPEDWKPDVELLANAAQAVHLATELEETSIAVARLVATCGDCHRKRGVKLELPEPDPPEETPMQMHAWGVQRMWEGLVIPSEDRLLRGTTTFAMLPRCDATLHGKDDLKTKCQRSKALAGKVHVARTQPERVDAYGGLLATCAGCHTKK
jgi:cytochrome c553